MKLLSDHPYYCHTENYYAVDASTTFPSWKEFYEKYICSGPFGTIENSTVDLLGMDYNLLFRWDLEEETDEEEKSFAPPRYVLTLFFMQQRKGKFVSVIVKNITEGDEIEIEEFLIKRWKHMKELWEPLSLV
jgi:hypothetical protein